MQGGDYPGSQQTGKDAAEDSVPVKVSMNQVDFLFLNTAEKIENRTRLEHPAHSENPDIKPPGDVFIEQVYPIPETGDYHPELVPVEPGCQLQDHSLRAAAVKNRGGY